MTKFIKLTSFDPKSRPFFINPDHIKRFFWNTSHPKPHTQIYFTSEDGMQVRETPEVILELIKDA